MTEPAHHGGSILTRKIGPLPGWAWGLIGIGGLLAVYLYRSKSGTSSAVTSSTDTSGAVPASDVPSFINQTYVTTTPPTASTPTNPMPSAGPAPTVEGYAMHPITRNQAKYLLKHGDKPYTLDTGKNEYVRTGTSKKPGSINSEKGQFFAGPLDYNNLLNRGKVKGP